MIDFNYTFSLNGPFQKKGPKSHSKSASASVNEDDGGCLNRVVENSHLVKLAPSE